MSELLNGVTLPLAVAASEAMKAAVRVESSLGAVKTMPRLCTNGVVVCLATGPSLSQEDVDYCRGKGAVIAVNDAWRLAPWADVLYSSDVPWWRHYNFVPDFKGIRVGLTRAGHPSQTALGPTFPGVVLSSITDTGIDCHPGRLATTKNSGGAAINLAVHLGARQIILLGYDMQPTPATHFFGDHPGSLQRKSPYPAFRSLIGTMVKPLAALGITVVNCTLSSALECFPKQPLREALS